MITPGEPLVAR